MNMSIRDWMTPDPITINGDNTLSVAYNLMRMNNVRHLPIVNDDEQLIGIITWGDVREARPKVRIKPSTPEEPNAAWEDHFLVATRDVREFMTPFPHYLRSDAPINEAAALMIEHKIGSLPIVENKRVVGIVTETDLFKFIVDTWAEVDTEASHMLESGS